VGIPLSPQIKRESGFKREVYFAGKWVENIIWKIYILKRAHFLLTT